MLLAINEGITYMNMTPICNEQDHHNLVAGRCPVCNRIVATKIPDEEEPKPQHKSLRDSEDLRKILP